MAVADRLSIKISPDRMRAYLSITGPVTLEEVFHELDALGIRHGVDLNRIQEACGRQGLATDLLIASGTPAEPGQSGSVEYYYHPPEIKPQLTADDRVNYYELGQIISIKAGEVLAVREPPTPGTPGLNIMGEPLKPLPGKAVDFAYCQGARIQGNELVADYDGGLTWQLDRIGVSKLLFIPGDIDFSIGNINYPGKVIVQGFIRESFTVIADEDIEVRGGIEGARVISHNGSVMVHGGIIGQDKSVIRAEKNVAAKFIQEAEVEAGISIIVNEYILRSTLKAGDAVLVQGVKGRIIGANTIQAHFKIKANTIRNSENLTLEVKGIDRYSCYCRIQYIKERLHSLECSLRDMSVQLRLLNTQKNTSVSKETLRKILDEYIALTREQEELQHEIKTLIQTLKSVRGDGMVEVATGVDSGTSFQIKNEHLRLSKTLKAVTIYYDHKEKRLVLF